MSRIGKHPIPVPAGVDIEVGDGSITVKGPKGALTQSVSRAMGFTLEGGALVVSRPSESKEHRSLHGLTRTLVANMVEGVTNGYRRVLEVHGVGYRTALSGQNLTLSVGYSHGIEVPPHEGITFEVGVDSQTRVPFVVISGIDKQLVGQTAAQVRRLRKPEPYKGKGIRYRGEHIRRKAGKQARAGGKK
ncbi:MAG TPA: 50S ribosomal protein L6 [Chthonomonadales bacterium]|nr:50S ribosomal protein L6 [Chthonomonadales bacterium]